jgi:Spore Coat Protein U domain
MRAMSGSSRVFAAVVVCFAGAGKIQAQCSWITTMSGMNFGGVQEYRRRSLDDSSRRRDAGQHVGWCGMPRADTFAVTFPAYSPLSAVAVPGATTVKVYCTKTTPATFALDNGLNASGVQKRMVNAGNFLNYTATLASASGVSGTSLAPIGGGVALTASIPPGQDLPAAGTSYIDTLQVVVNY